MKKLLTALAILGMFSAPALWAQGAENDTDPHTDKDVVTYKFKASTEVSLGVSSESVVYAHRGFINITETWLNIQPYSSGSFAGGINTGLIVSTSTLQLTLSNSATSYPAVNFSTQPVGVPRNIVGYASATFHGTSTTTLLIQATFYGLDNQGNSVSELIQFSTTTPDLSTGPAQMQGAGSIAWSYVSSVTIRVSSITAAYGLGATSVRLILGYGYQWGLSNEIMVPEDVYMVQENGWPVVIDPTSGRVNPKFNTYHPSQIFGNKNDFALRYRVKKSPVRIR